MAGRIYNRGEVAPMPIYGYVIVALGSIAWFLPFPRTGWSRVSPAQRDSRARWGIGLQTISYAVLWQGQFWLRSPGVWRVGWSMLLLVLAALLSWTATRALGRYLRFEAALSPDHQLVRSGPYGVLRHPIYTSMLCLLLGTGAMVATPLLLLLALLLFLVGTEIRVQVEDRLLADRFGDEFRRYQEYVPAYIPFLR
jgi:protein-S-isoprenylcysteine O-methyltransferase Ste14